MLLSAERSKNSDRGVWLFALFRRGCPAKRAVFALFVQKGAVAGAGSGEFPALFAPNFDGHSQTCKGKKEGSNAKEF